MQATLFAPHRAEVARFRLELVAETAEPYDTAPALSDPAAVARFCAERFGREPFEIMAALYLDCRLRLIGYHVAYRGTLSRAAVEPRGILVPGLLCNAASVVICHNHPSGDPSPSAEDLAFTRRVADAGEIVGIRLADHLILGDGGRFVSLRQRGGW